MIGRRVGLSIVLGLGMLSACGPGQMLEDGMGAPSPEMAGLDLSTVQKVGTELHALQDVNMRSGPNTTHGVVSVVVAQQTVVVEEERVVMGWFHVRHQDKTGWIYGDYLGVGKGTPPVPATPPPPVPKPAPAAPDATVAAPSKEGTAVAASNSRMLGPEELDLFQKINAYRWENGKPLVTNSFDLNTVAYNHAGDMVARVYLAHTTPEGVTAAERIKAAHPNSHWWGEIIAAGNFDADGTMAQWKPSPPHNNNLLHDKAGTIGIGRFEGEPNGRYRVMWVVVFADE